MKSRAAYRVRDRVVVGGVTALRGQTGTVRGVRMGDPYTYFVCFDKKWWPLIAENGMWVREDHLAPLNNESIKGETNVTAIKTRTNSADHIANEGRRLARYAAELQAMPETFAGIKEAREHLMRAEAMLNGIIAKNATYTVLGDVALARVVRVAERIRVANREADAAVVLLHASIDDDPLAGSGSEWGFGQQEDPS